MKGFCSIVLIELMVDGFLVDYIILRLVIIFQRENLKGIDGNTRGIFWGEKWIFCISDCIDRFESSGSERGERVGDRVRDVPYDYGNSI